MRHGEFSDTLIQAINDWQRGGSPEQKKRRGLALKSVCPTLDDHFRSTVLCCFRQVALTPTAIWELHNRLQLAETISSWTLTTDVAKTLKGGVPPEGLQGVILETVPPPGCVVVNLDALFREQKFVDACRSARSRISGYVAGIGRYGNSQHEVVLELESVPISSVYALGGRSGSREDIARMYFNREPTAEEWRDFDARLRASGTELGPNWIAGSEKDRVLTKTFRAFGVIKKRRADG